MSKDVLQYDPKKGKSVQNLPWPDILEWDVYNWKKAVAFWEKHWPADPGMALELGARHGGLSLYLALQGFQVICSDLTQPDIKAQERHQKHHVAEQVTYTALDALDLDVPSNTFDVVVFKSILGGIGRIGHTHLKQQAIQEMHRILKPGGYLLFGENLCASRLHQWLRQWVPWSKYWGYVTMSEMQMLLAPFQQVQLSSYGCLGLLGRTEWQRNLLGHLDDWVEPWLLSESHYLVCGVAQK